jgi:hypothetical protein
MASDLPSYKQYGIQVRYLTCNLTAAVVTNFEQCKVDEAMASIDQYHSEIPGSPM